MVSNRRDDFNNTKRSQKNDLISFKIPNVREDKNHSTNYEKKFKKITENFN